ncbi:hypothetical protein [Pseudohalocynthiibacter aestuariivivens]|uniref:hypothetical protein n=1 Tax=Pseudohalocynthiibacter aestuariivivens TaxID=1591409 RepID=UPI001FE49ADA|nr:hypothetical protein [Pseudohalocynthiibacter aestuariivivens]
MPASELETVISTLVADRLNDETFVLRLIPEIESADLQIAQATLKDISKSCLDNLVTFLGNIKISPGMLTIELNPTALASMLKVSPSKIETDALTLVSTFQRKRRGVETRLVLGAGDIRHDPTLIRNILKARDWYDKIKKGARFADIAKQEKTSTRRVQQMIGLAFLNPDTLKPIADGTQPVALTSEWFKRNALPDNWDAQRQAFAEL